jgi:hypothetical protein
LANLATVNPSQKAFEIVDLYYPETHDTEVQPEQDAEKVDFDPFGEVNIDTEQFDDYKGVFELDGQPGFTIAFTRENNKFFAKAIGQQRFQIYPSSDTSFFLKAVKAYVTFHRDANGIVNTMTLHQNGAFMAHRVDEDIELFEPGQEELQDYTGKFSSEELATYYTLAVEDGKLTFSHPRAAKRKLNPIEKDKFQIEGLPGEISFERDSSGNIISLRLSMMPRTRNLLFIKLMDE